MYAVFGTHITLLFYDLRTVIKHAARAQHQHDCDENEIAHAKMKMEYKLGAGRRGGWEGFFVLVDEKTKLNAKLDVFNEKKTLSSNERKPTITSYQ